MPFVTVPYFPVFPRVCVTPDHPVFADRSWASADKLHGMRFVFTVANPVSPVISVSRQHAAGVLLYNLRTKIGTYLVGRSGMVVSGRVVESKSPDSAPLAKSRDRHNSRLPWYVSIPATTAQEGTARCGVVR